MKERKPPGKNWLSLRAWILYKKFQTNFKELMLPVTIVVTILHSTLSPEAVEKNGLVLNYV